MIAKGVVVGEQNSYSDVTILIPTLNEEEAIGPVLDEILSLGVPRERILVVDGHSRDKTVQIASSKGVRVVEQEGWGKADALKTAARMIPTRYVLVMDGDYTYPAKYIPTLLSIARRGVIIEAVGRFQETT
jgi:glycosyltransferase involved in cell wall biosynthesis